MKRRRVQVGAWTLVYSWRMDSQYVRTVLAREVAVQFSSFRDGWTSSFSLSCAAADARRGSTSADLTTGDSAIAARTAESLRKPRAIGLRARNTSAARRADKITPRISERWWPGSAQKPKR